MTVFGNLIDLESQAPEEVVVALDDLAAERPARDEITKALAITNALADVLDKAFQAAKRTGRPEAAEALAA